MRARVQQKRIKRTRTKARVRARIFGMSSRPRLTVFRSLSQIYAQIINDQNGKTLASASSLTAKTSGKKPKVDLAFQVGQEIAKKAKEAGITKISFDRNGYPFHGRIKALAEGAREGGLEF